MSVSVLSVKAEDLSNFYFFKVCMDMCVCASRGCRGVSVWIHVCICSRACGGQRIAPSAVSQELPAFVFSFISCNQVSL